MPWRKKQSYPKSPYWVSGIGALFAILFGVLIGYTRWGTTASVVDLVERELTKAEARIETLEKRLVVVESRLGVPKAEEASVAAPAVQGKKTSPTVR